MQKELGDVGFAFTSKPYTNQGLTSEYKNAELLGLDAKTPFVKQIVYQKDKEEKEEEEDDEETQDDKKKTTFKNNLLLFEQKHLERISSGDLVYNMTHCWQCYSHTYYRKPNTTTYYANCVDDVRYQINRISQFDFAQATMTCLTRRKHSEMEYISCKK